MRLRILPRSESGFTLVELVNVIAASVIFVALILYFGISYWRYSSLLEADLTSFGSRLDVQDVIRELVGTSSGLILQNSIPDPNANNPDPVAGSNYWITEHSVPGNIAVGGSGTTTPLLYFRHISINTSKTIAMNGSAPYEDEYVLYLNGTTKQLMLRTLANPNVSNNKAVTSCPPTLATATCPADKTLLSDVASVDTTYYSRSGNTIDWHSLFDNNINSYAGPDFPLVEALQYDFHIQKKALFQTSTSTFSETIIRIALRNT